MAGRLLLVALLPVRPRVLTVLGRAAAAAHLEGTARGARRRSVVATALTALVGRAALALWPAFALATLLAVSWPSPRVQAEPGPLSDAVVA